MVSVLPPRFEYAAREVGQACLPQSALEAVVGHRRDGLFASVPKAVRISIYDVFARYGCPAQRWLRPTKAFCNRGFIIFGHAHLTALVAAGIVRPQFLHNAFKFAFVRNRSAGFIGIRPLPPAPARPRPQTAARTTPTRPHARAQRTRNLSAWNALRRVRRPVTAATRRPQPCCHARRQRRANHRRPAHRRPAREAGGHSRCRGLFHRLAGRQHCREGAARSRRARACRAAAIAITRPGAQPGMPWRREVV